MPYFKVEEKATHLLLTFLATDSSNALSLAVARELSSIQNKYKTWKRPVVVSSGHPQIFCAGGNLSDYAKLNTRAEGLKINREIQKHLDRFGAWPVVKIALIDGDVFGGGVEWLARFDFRWATAHARLGFWQRRIGLSSGWGGGSAWAAKLGDDKVRTSLVEGKLVGASEARAQGLIDRIYTGWRMNAAVAEFCAGLNQPEMQDLVKWNSKSEARLFSKLWWGKTHHKVLQSWKSSRLKQSRT